MTVQYSPNMGPDSTQHKLEENFELPQLEPTGMSRRNFLDVARYAALTAAAGLALSACAPNRDIGPGAIEQPPTPAALEKGNYDAFLLETSSLALTIVTALGEDRESDRLRWSDDEGYVRYQNKAAQQADEGTTDEGKEVDTRRQMSVELSANGLIECRYIDDTNGQNFAFTLWMRPENPGREASLTALRDETPTRAQVLSAVADPSMLELRSYTFNANGAQHTIRLANVDPDEYATYRINAYANSAPISINDSRIVTGDSASEMPDRRQGMKTVAERLTESYVIKSEVAAAA